MSSARVIIMGAGPSGIAAASRLLENGLTDIIVLEAEDRIGGRINTVNFDDGVIDLGGQWVAGERGNVVFAMANPLNLLRKSITCFLNDTSPFVVSSGKLFSMNEISHLLDIINAINKNSKTDYKTYKGSVGEYFTSEFQKHLKEKNLSLEDNSLANSILDWYEKFEKTTNASETWFETSANGLSQYDACEGHLFWSWKTGGYGTVLDLLMRKYPDQTKELPVLSKILFKKEVEKITWNDMQDGKAGKVVVNCTDKSTYVADHVLITVSLGVLKEKADSLFYPPLPEEKLLSIKGLGFGTISKMFLKFPHRWWPSDIHGFSFLWSEKDKEDFVIFNRKQTRDKSWLQGILGFYDVDNHPSTLITFGVGPCARHMEQLMETEVIEDLMELLSRFLGEKYNIPQPTGFKRSLWNSNPHFRGACSYRTLQSDKMGASPSLLAKPVANSLGKEVLLFAGEATHECHYGAVHGAIETGWREGDRLLKLCW